MISRFVSAALLPLATLALGAASLSGQTLVNLTNGDFDLAVMNFGGFDSPNDVPGWTDYGTTRDAGVEGPAAWWGPYDNHAAFLAGGDGAFTMSDYIIQEGDVFSIDFMAKWWNWTGSEGQITATLFSESTFEVLGSFTTANLGDAWAPYMTLDGIAATPGSIGGTLGILIQSTGTGHINIDEVQVMVSNTIVPEPATASLALGAAALLFAARRRRTA